MKSLCMKDIRFINIDKKLISNLVKLKVGFPANETFHEKVRKFSVASCKLFCEISHVCKEINEAKFFFTKILV